MIIGLTGTYCAGKNYVGAILEKKGIPVIDIDKLGHIVLDEEKEKIAAVFGNAVLSPDGKIDRRSLGKQVFGDTEKLIVLENIVHPAVNRKTDEWLKEKADSPCVINAAVLHKSSAFKKLTALIIVEAPYFTRLLRAKKRDRLSWISLIKRFGSQKDFVSQYFKENSDIYRVENKGSFASQLKLEKRIDEILSLIGIEFQTREN
jgi:dephospho-CoA kinase